MNMKEERVAHLARLAARGFTRALQTRLAGFDMTFGQWIFLRMLWEEDGLTQRTLSERARLTDPTTHAALVKLEKFGYVVRKRIKHSNRRPQYVFLTEQGRALKDALEPLAIEVNAVATHGLSNAEVEELRRLLIVLIENLAHDETQAAAEGRSVPPTRRSA